MHAFLYISSQNPEELPLIELVPSEFHTSLFYEVQTIDAVRALKKSFKFAPREKTLIVMSGLDEAKHEAQNALLKLLEEPPSENLIFFLISKSEDAIIPTILSRLTVIKKNTETQISKSSKQLTGEPSSWFLQFSKINDRDDAIEIVNTVLNDTSLIKYHEAALETLKALKRNGSVQLQLTNFLSKTS